MVVTTGNNHSWEILTTRMLKARGPSGLPVVKIPKLHSVNAMLALAPNVVADVSNNNMIGLMAKVAAQLKRLNLCALMGSLVRPELIESASRPFYNVMKASVETCVTTGGRGPDLQA